MDFRGYGIVHYDSRDSRGIDCAILYDTMVFELEGSDFLDFEYLKRGVVCARFVYRSTGRCVTVFSVHLPSRLGGGRASALRSLALRALDSISYCTPTPVIVMGDMNSEPKHLGSLYNCAVVPFGLGVGSYVYRDVWSMPCQILVSYQLRPYVFGDQRVVLDSSLLTPSGRFRGYPHRNRPSDHLPVYIDIEL